MLNTNRKTKIIQSNYIHPISRTETLAGKGYFNFLLKKLKKKELKKDKEKFIYLYATVGVLIVSGVIISF